MEGLTSNPGASRWIVSSPGPGLVKHQVKSQKKQQLLHEASQMTPDSSALAQQLGLADLGAADSYLYGAQLNSALNEYMTNYRDNPYYAFSREGVQKVRDMQNLVRDPRLNAMKQAYKSSQESYKKKSEEGLGGYHIVKNGNLVIVDKETGNLREVNPDNLDPSKHAVPTYQEAYDYLTSKRGFHSQKLEDIKPLDNHMANPSEVIDQINKWFQGLGQTQQEQYKNALGELTDASRKTTSNTSQIKSKLRAILSDTGLPQNFRDTIFAQYYTNALNSGKKPTRADAENAMYQMIGQIAEGQNIFKEDLNANPALVGANARKSLEEVSPLMAAISGANAKPVGIPLTNSDTGRVSIINALPLPTKYLDMVRPGAVYKTDDNIVHPKRNVKDMSLFALTDTNNIMVPNLYTGETVKLPAEARRLLGEFVVSNTQMHGVAIKRSDSGQSYLHGTNPDVEDKDSEHVLMLDVMIPANRALGRDGGGGKSYQALFDYLSANGYKTEPITSNEWEQFKANANNPDIEEPIVGTPDDAYKFKIVVPVNPSQLNDLDNLPVGNTVKGFNTIDFMEAMPSSNNSATQDPRKGNPFSTFGDL